MRPSESAARACLLVLALAFPACSSDDGAGPNEPLAPQPVDGAAVDGSAPVVVNPGGFDGGATPDAPPATAADASVDGGADDAAVVARRPRPIERGAVLGPIDGSGAPPAPTHGPTNLHERGYIQEEYILSGDAREYAAQGELGLDGKWGATTKSEAPFKTRLLIRRPAQAESFNGTVLVEWLNVTGSMDIGMGYAFAWEELLRGGYAYVGVSVQKAGVDTLKIDARYGDLTHPGDLYAYDIFAQAGAALGWPGKVDALAGLEVERLIAYGESQSAMRMITFVNAIQPLTHVYDGIIVHSRAGWGAPVGSDGDPLLGSGKPVQVRADSDARVLQIFSESELFLALGPAFAARQPDTDRLRTWEIAGTAHADARVLGNGTDFGCGMANAGPQHLLVKAGIRGVHGWLKSGIAPAKGQPITADSAQKAIARDEHGNALGGIRSPHVDVPIATLSGESWNPACMLFGSTVPFTAQKLQTLYPTHQDYVAKVTSSARAARDAGFLLAEDEPSVIAEAVAAKVPN